MSGIRNLALLVDLARHLQHVAPRHFDSQEENHDDEKQKDDPKHDCGWHTTQQRIKSKRTGHGCKNDGKHSSIATRMHLHSSLDTEFRPRMRAARCPACRLSLPSTIFGCACRSNRKPTVKT